MKATSFVSLCLAATSALAANTSKKIKLVSGVTAVLSTPAATFTCANGEYLTYSIVSSEVPGVSLKLAQAYFSDWAEIAPGTHLNSTGTSGVGATRAYVYAGSVTKREQLTAVIAPTSGNSNLEQKFSLIQPVVFSNPSKYTVYQAWDDLTIGSDSNGNVFLQLYVNACVSNQSTAAKGLPLELQADLNYWISQVLLYVNGHKSS